MLRGDISFRYLKQFFLVQYKIFSSLMYWQYHLVITRSKKIHCCTCMSKLTIKIIFFKYEFWYTCTCIYIYIYIYTVYNAMKFGSPNRKVTSPTNVFFVIFWQNGEFQTKWWVQNSCRPVASISDNQYFFVWWGELAWWCMWCSVSHPVMIIYWGSVNLHLNVWITWKNLHFFVCLTTVECINIYM